jgi:hypothetical protein
VKVQKRLGADWRRLICLELDGKGMCSFLTNLTRADPFTSDAGSWKGCVGATGTFGEDAWLRQAC